MGITMPANDHLKTGKISKFSEKCFIHFQSDSDADANLKWISSRPWPYHYLTFVLSVLWYEIGAVVPTSNIRLDNH